MKKINALFGLLIVTIFLFAVFPANAASNDTTKSLDGLTDIGIPRTQESYVVESAHNYANNFDYTWTITKAGATQIKVYFEKIEVENNYDYLYVYDGSGAQLHKLTGGPMSGWSAVSYSDTIKIRLDTDYSVTKYGFKVTYIDYEGGSTSDTTAPVVDITAPSNGATVSDTVSISYTATDANGISSRAIKIDGTTVSTGTSYSWDTTGYSNGAHTISVEATDPSGNTGTDSISVTVDNEEEPVSNELTNGVASSGSLSDNSDYFTWTIDVGANAASMRVYLTCGSADFDFFASHLTSDPTHSNKEFEGYTSGGEDVTFNNPGAGTWYVKVDAYSGAPASYQVTVTVTYQAADTTAPVVSITNPGSGTTVSGTVSITYTASDANGISSRAIKIDGVTKSTGTSYSWDTTGYSNGAHTIRVEATDPSSNTGYDQITVTVDNSGPSTNELTSGVTATSSLSATGATEMWFIIVADGMSSMDVILTCGSADFDVYGRLGAEPTTSTYDFRGYTSGGEEVTQSNPGEGTWYIMVRSYSGTGSYGLTVTLTEGGSTGDGDWGTGGKYAIIMGISNYQSISDLSYCDEDAYDWYQYLTGKGYEVHVFYDGSYTSNMYTSIPTSSGAGSSGKVDYGTEANVRAAIQGLANHAQSGDKVAYITSGHGSGDGNGNSYLCMWDCSGSAGCYYDYEIASDLGGFASGVNIFVFIDHCYSGGIGPELMSLSNSQYIYCTTTCTEDGYGYDDPTHNNGAWTYEFLEKYLVGSPNSSMESIYDQASASYSHTGGDASMEFDGNSGSYFYL